MVKEFKEFDKKYAKFKGTARQTIDQERFAFLDLNDWPFMADFREDYTIDQIRYAVYDGLYAEEWQKFRVSLKGLTTKEKLYCLYVYWTENVQTPGIGWKLNEIRVNNYLGAMKRGGLLTSELEIRR